MSRFFRLCILLPLLILSVRAAQPRRYAAVVVDCSPGCRNTALLLEGLYDRGVTGTFLLQGRAMAAHPELLSRILADGHEVGCRGYSGSSMTGMSRRTIAAEIREFQALLPEGQPLRLFCPPGGCGDGVRQVAEARHLAILSWSADVRTPSDKIPDGCLILLQDNTPLHTVLALKLIDALLEADYEIISVSALARLRGVGLVPGKTYDRFPPGG